MSKKKDIISKDPRTGDLTNINNVMQPLLRRMLGKKAFAEAEVICHWKEIAGEEMFGFSKPLRIEFKKDERTGGVLWLETAGGAFALEIQLKSKLLIEKINTFFGYEAVKEIKIVQNPGIKTVAKETIHNSEKKLVTAEEENYIRELNSDIQDSTLRESLEKLCRAVIVNNKK